MPARTPIKLFAALVVVLLAPATADAASCNGPRNVCSLQFAVQPASAEKNAAISGTAYTPGGPAVSVRVLDRDGAPIAIDGTRITISRGISNGLGALVGTTQQTTVDGVATFPGLSITSAGLYRLAASAPTMTGATSSPFTVVDDADTCNAGAGCGVASQASRLSIEVQAAAGDSAGTLVSSIDTGVPIECTGYRAFGGSWAVVDGPARAKTLTYLISKAEMQSQKDRGAASMNMCFAYPQPFTQKAGTPLDAVAALFDFDGDGDLDPGYRGLLPDCGTAGATHCVASRSKTGSGQGLMVVQAPALAGDPAYRG